MKFTLEIELGNEAMQTLADVAKALDNTQHIADADESLTVGQSRGIRDINGNTVGKWQVSA